jgi:hypothetical protein
MDMTCDNFIFYNFKMWFYVINESYITTEPRLQMSTVIDTLCGSYVDNLK